MLQECLKLELAQHAILVTNAVPGPVNTRMLQVGMAADVDVFPDSAEYVPCVSRENLLSLKRLAVFAPGCHPNRRLKL